MVDLGDGRLATASIALKVYPDTRRIRAVLRWAQDGKSPERYLGEVEHGSRTANLTEAWSRAQATGLLVEEALPADSKASSHRVRTIMRANRGRDTRPELALRSLLYARGLRYRVNVRPIPALRRSADVVFFKEKVAVFVDGCYWHGCPDHYRPATKNAECWDEKICANRARDVQTNCALIGAGWMVIRVWEHEDFAQAAQHITEVVRGRREAHARTVVAESIFSSG